MEKEMMWRPKSPRSMEVLELHKVLVFSKKTKHKAADGRQNGQYKFFTSSSIQSKYIDEFDYDGEYLVFGTGGNASVHYCNGKFSTTADCLVAQVRKSSISGKYVYYYLDYNIHLLEAGFRGAGLKHISKSYIRNVRIAIPKSHETQLKFVSIFEKAEQLEQWREESDKLTDDYLNSVFLKMFGTCNPQYDSWREVQLQELASDRKGSMRTGPFGSDLRHSEFVDSGVAVLGIDNAVNNDFCWKERRYITEEKFQKLKRYKVFPGDVIITIMGTVGRSAVIPEDIPQAINTKHLVAITLNQQLANPYFISYSIHSNPEILVQLRGRNRGAIMHGLNLSIIKELRFKLPPIALQNKFAEIFKRVKEMKEVQKRSKQHIKDLFKVLMQKAFRGELVC